MTQMNKDEMLKLLSALRKAKLMELNAYIKEWGENPTYRQSQRIKKARKAYEDAIKIQQTFKKLMHTLPTE